MQMDVSSRVISSLTSDRGECLMAYSDFLILGSFLILLQTSVTGYEIGHLMHSVYYQLKLGGNYTAADNMLCLCVYLYVCNATITPQGLYI